MDISINKNSLSVVKKMIEIKDVLGIEMLELKNGTKVIDAGVNTEGSIQAGILISEVCLGGLGKVKMIPWKEGDLWLQGVSVEVNHPVIACMASQYAGWKISKGSFFAMGSGPARVLAGKEELFERITYREKEAKEAVLFMESGSLPTEEVAEYIAKHCKVKTEKLWLIVAPTASMVGSIQISARIVETGIHKLLELGFDINKIKFGFGSCPVAPIIDDDLQALGRTNDCVLYGGSAFYTIAAGDSEIKEIIARVPSSSSNTYGKPFIELFEECGRDFYKMDPMLFSPARVVINNCLTGRMYTAGKINPEVLSKSLGFGN